MKKKKRLKILETPWHVPHNHDLMMALKDIADFDLLINYTRRWDERNRELPKNASWVIDIQPNKYDFAILHLDQQCSNLNLNKSILTRHMKKVIKEVDPKLPIVFINHGTPVYPELYPDAKAPNYISNKLRKEILSVVGNDFMVVNSKQSAKDWGRGYPIIHGMDEKEWIYNKDKEPRVCTFVSQAGIGDKYYNRSYLAGLMEVLYDKYGISLQWINTTGCFNAKNIKDYKEFLGKCLIYFNPTFASPMPRSRTEAMLSGCCIVSLAGHDIEDYIKDGENGFIVPRNDINFTAELIKRLLDNYEYTKEVGRKGRETALKHFNRKRYAEDWKKFIKEELKI